MKDLQSSIMNIFNTNNGLSESLLLAIDKPDSVKLN
jgi:hypothetical protein